MANRRQILTGLPAAVVATIAAGNSPAARAAAEAQAVAQQPKPNVIDTRVRDAFPDVEMTDQHGRTHRLYDDLIANNIVLLNFMSIRDETSLAVTAKLAELAQVLGDKLTDGALRMISATRDPKNDSPALLQAFAQEHRVPKNWFFLTGSQHNANDLSLRMYRMNHGHHAGARKTDIVFYGNGSAGVWGGFPVDIQVSDMAERITWVMPRSKREGKITRAGPRVYDAADRRNHNRQA
jgi:cytochrome oxidase Cu insertion factor (SCO1/SenC/PrrC family)